MSHPTPPQKIKGSGSIIGKPAPDFCLRSADGKDVRLADVLATGPALLAFYPGDFTQICTRQLCGYQESYDKFQSFGVNLYGISSNSSESHLAFASQYKFAFPLLSDPWKETAKAYGCTSLLMLGSVTRAVFVINAKGLILYRYVEPTVFTHRSADELLGILGDLKKNGLI